MDFLKRLGSNILDYFKGPGDLSKLNPSSNAAGVINGLDFSKSNPIAEQANRNTQEQRVERPEVEYYEDRDDGFSYGTNNGNIIKRNRDGSPGTTYYNAQGGQNPAYNDMVRLRSSTSTKKNKVKAGSGQVDQYGRTSTREMGNPYIDASGKLVIPKTSFSGTTGSGGSGYTTVPSQGQSGTAGLGGGSAYNGVTSGVGTGGTSINTSEEDEESLGARSIEEVSGKITSDAVNSIGAPFNSTQFQPPEVPDIIDAGYISKVSESINKLKNSGTALSAADRESTIQSIMQNLVTAKQRLDQQQPVPENPVIDTQEQLDFLNSSEDPFGVKQAMDEFRDTQTNLGELQRTRVDLMKNVQALNEAYTPIIKDIKENPDLPKALARRRLEDLASSQKEVLEGFLNQLEIVNQQINDQDEMVNRQFQILSMTQNQEERARDNARQNLQLMISSGAIGGFSDADIKRTAQTLGISEKALRKAKEAALTPDVEIVTNEDANGNLVGIDKNTGKTMWSVAGMGKTGGENTKNQWQEENAEIDAARALLSSKDTATGIPYTDAGGYFTVEGLRLMLENTTLSRSRFLSEFGDRISPWNYNNYSLTPAEIKSLGYEPK